MEYLQTFKRKRRGRAFPGARSAFTLVELLTVIAIIGMLSAVSISTVRISIETAREAQTETTVAKIDSSLTSLYEKYQYRRIDLSDKVGTDGTIIRAAARLERIRDLLRCDFPACPEDLTTPFIADGLPTPLQVAYNAAVAKSGGFAPDAKDDPADPDTFHTANAELLYLVIMNADPEARAGFSDREVADTNGNGLYEFVDGWGKPICWARWATGFERSDRQPSLAGMLGGDFDPKIDSDPFNPLGLAYADGSGWYVSTTSESAETTEELLRAGWFLVPLVYSAGPDGYYGLNPAVCVGCDPFSPALVNPAAAPGASDGSKTDKDNITNHTLVR